MKLWLLFRTDQHGYDTYDSCVVAANTADDARLIHPSGSDYKWNGREWKSDPDWTDDSWTSPNTVSVKEIGTASDGISGVICASFNAG